MNAWFFKKCPTGIVGGKREFHVHVDWVETGVPVDRAVIVCIHVIEDLL